MENKVKEKEDKLKAKKKAVSQKPADKTADKAKAPKKRAVSKKPVKEAPSAAEVVKKEKPVSAKKPVVLKAKQSEAKKEEVALKPQPKPTVEVKKKIEAPKAPPPKVEPPKAPPKPVVQPAKPVVQPPKAAPTPPPPPPPPEPVVEKGPRVLEFDVPIMLKDLAIKIGVKANEIIFNLMSKKMLVTINQNLGQDIVTQILTGYGIEYKKPAKVEEQVKTEHKELEDKQDIAHIVARPPVVTFMGHVDHGKTSLLDFIRKTRVADKEKGGITQHIGAYEVRLPTGSVTFLDTPGHEAFTAMRARGANATDVVVLVVAADDGVMPQTKEALDHARAAGVTIVVALNKCDLPSANIDKVKGQLSQIGLMPEDWGGKTTCVNVSAKTGEGVDQLLEMLVLESDLLELKANPKIRARGVVVEAKLSSGQGPVATMLVKNGTLKLGDMVLSGMYYGRVKAMIDDKGQQIEEAPPSKPVTILGLSGVPMAGDEFFVVKDERKARTLSVLKKDEERSRRLRLSKRVTLEDFYKNVKEGSAKELSILLKGDVQGSLEALKESLLELSTKEIKVNIIHSDVGTVNESDVMLAVVANGVIIGFNVKVDEKAEAIAAKEGIEIKIYGIIYEAMADVKAAMEGLLEPIEKEVFVGRAQVKQVFKVTKAGTIAGCMIVKGKMARSGTAKLIRNKEVVYQGRISGLKRFKDDVREVAEGFECGIGLDRHDDIKPGDLIELYQIEKIARRLESRK